MTNVDDKLDASVFLDRPPSLGGSLQDEDIEPVLHC